jgi:hypothetical protein
MDDAIPYTTHNSSACAIIETPEGSLLDELISRAVKHIEHHFIQGSDPGLCVACENHPALSRLISFGRGCTRRVVTQAEALQAASGVHLSGYGGTNDGLIGAAAAVGLTAYGWGGRFIEFGRLRDFPEMVLVSELERAGMAVVSIDRDGKVPAPEDRVNTKGWLRPRLWGRTAVLPVIPGEDHAWEMVGDKKRNEKEG